MEKENIFFWKKFGIGEFYFLKSLYKLNIKKFSVNDCAGVHPIIYKHENGLV
jgi:hypothetical protein